MLLVVPGFTWGAFAITITGCVLGILMLGAAMIGFIVAPVNVVERMLLGLASLCLIAPSLASTAVGLLVALPVLVHQMVIWQRARRTPASIDVTQ